MVQKVTDGAWVEADDCPDPPSACVCPPAAAPSAQTLSSLQPPCPPSVAPRGFQGLSQAHSDWYFPHQFSPAHDLDSSVSVPSPYTFVLVRLAPLRSTSGRVLPSVRWSILFLLQEWPTFWTLFRASPLSAEICPKQSRGGLAPLQVIHYASSEPVGKFSQYELLLTLMRF